MAGSWNGSFSEKPKGEETKTPEEQERRMPFDLPVMPIKITPVGDEKRVPFTVPAETTPQPKPQPKQPAVDYWRPSTGGAPASKETQSTPVTAQRGAPFQEVKPPVAQPRPGLPEEKPLGDQWRSPYGDIADPAKRLPPIDTKPPQRDRNPQNDPNYNGGVTVPGDPGKWAPAIEQLPGGENGTDPVPTTGNDGLNLVTEQQRLDVENSKNTQLNYFRHFGEAALGGLAGSSIIPYLGDKLAWKSGLDPKEGVSWYKQPLRSAADYWRENHSPLGLEMKSHAISANEIKLRGLEIETQLRTAIDERTAARRDFFGTKGTAGGTASTGFHAMEELRDQVVAARDRTLATATGTGTPSADNPILARKAQLIEEMIASRPTTADHFAQQRAKIDMHKMPAGLAHPTEMSFLTEAEVALLKEQSMKYEALVTKKNAVTDLENAQKAAASELRAVEEQMLALRKSGGKFDILGTKKTWQDPVRPGAGPWEKELTTWKGDNKWRAAGEGIGIVATGLAVNYAVDKFMPDILGAVGGQDAKLFSKHQYWLQGPAVTAAMVYPGKSFVWRVGATALAVGGSTAVDWLAPGPPNATYSKLMQPNWGDAFGMSAAWMLPFGSWKSRAVAVGGAWLGARGLNALDSVVDVPGIESHHFAQGMDNDVRMALKSEKISEGNFRDIVSKGHTLGMENEGALWIHMSDFMNTTSHDPLWHLHGSAALYTAYGDLCLSRGTKMDPNTSNDKSRLIVDPTYDLGGQATTYYRQALTNLVEGQNQANASSRPIESKAMAEAQKVVVEKLEKIYGAHNIPSIIEKLKGAYKNDIGALSTYKVHLKEEIDGLLTRDTTYAAKMDRDLALLNLAIVSMKVGRNEGGGATAAYEEALDYLERAEELKPDHPDVKALRQYADSLKGSVPHAVRQQEKNRFNNPSNAKL